MSQKNIHSIFQKQRDFFDAGRTRDLEFRLRALDALKKAVLEHEGSILDAALRDMGKPSFEAFASEIFLVLEEINYAKKNLRTWAQPKKVQTSILALFSKSEIHAEPLGQILVIAPWNYPFQLSLTPLVSAIAAGNCVIVKPSEISENSSRVIHKLISEAFEPEFVTCVEGGVSETQELLKEHFNHIFFTGSTGVGKKIYEAAAKTLSPVTLELGGKSPCIVDKNTDLRIAAKRIVWGKFFNVGQTCVAPDYLVVHKSIKDKFVSACIHQIEEFFGKNPQESPEYGRIINKTHFDRLKNLTKDCKIIYGGKFDEEDRYISPTLVEGANPEAPIMQQEIFGPLLPILTFETFQDLMITIRNQPDPLSLYVFTSDSEFEKKVLSLIPFGGGCVNDTLMHLNSTQLPFGGRGTSGIGAYHGRTGFGLFSHQKGILKAPRRFDLPIRYAPYKEWKTKLLRMLT
ncbi:MAG: aldehyde dehydrogenase [Bacteriovoracia bacterium]